MDLDMTLIFDGRSKRFFTEQENNDAFITEALRHLTEMNERRGYLYLREVYEELGLDAKSINPNLGWEGSKFEYSVSHDPTTCRYTIRHNAQAMS